MSATSLIDRAIARSLRELRGIQRPDGGFPAFSSSDLASFTNARGARAVFPSALIARSLAGSAPADPRVRAIVLKTAAYLLKERSASWSWNYWERGSKDAKALPYPDDLDDTFAALGALEAAKGELLPGDALAKIVQLLFQTEASPGGPYRTWLVAPEAAAAWRDTDLAVNANIGAFFAMKDVSLPGLAAFVERRIRRDDYRSPYYPSPYPVAYFLSLWYRGAAASCMVRFLLARRRGGRWPTPQETALALSALLNLGVSPLCLRKAAAWLATKGASGRFAAESSYTDPAVEGVPHYGGSPALTTAFVVEALLRYRSAVRREEASRNAALEARTRAAISAYAARRLAKLPPALRSAALSRVRAMAAKDKDGGIMLLSSRFAASLKRSAAIPAALSGALGAVNLLGWAGYDLLDDIWDGDAPARELPVADALVRETVRLYEELLRAPAEQRLFYGLMDGMDEAVRFELAECRAEVAGGRVSIAALPRFGAHEALSARSLPHALGPLLIFARAGHPPGTKAHRAFLSFFEAYLIARQLNDDAHDWEDDLFRGRLSPVVAAVLRASRKRTVEAGDREALRKLFWKKIIFNVAADIAREIARARRSLRALEPFFATAMFEALLQPLHDAAEKAVNEAHQAQDFMKAYKS